MKNIFSLLIIIFCSQANAEVFVSSIMQSDVINESIDVPAGRYLAIPLPQSGNSNDELEVVINTRNGVFKDITAYVLDEENLTSFKQGYRFKGVGYDRAVTPFTIQVTIPNNAKRYLLLDNRYAAIIKKLVNVSIKTKFELSTEQHSRFNKLFSELYGALEKNYIFPAFNVRVESCGQANAFSKATSSGDIHFCSELIDQLFRAGKGDAVIPIFFHEAGHSLLGLWGIPGHNNEDIADEFSTYILMSGGPNGYRYLKASLDFWRSRDSASEAMNMLQNGDRHSLSVQRMRNIEENMMTGEPFIKRWNKLVYQHLTDEALNDAAKKPKPGADVELANKLLEQRGNVSQ